MDASLWTFVFEIANFVALTAVLAWLFFKPVRKSLEEQQTKVRQIEEQAAQELMKAQREYQDIESQRERLASELELTRNKARDIARTEAEQLVSEARTQIDRERATLAREALTIERAQTARIAQAVATSTCSTMRRFLEQIEGPELEQLLLRTACRELVTLSSNSLSPVTVESATPLDDESRNMIESSLGSAATSAHFRIVSDLLGGLRISTSRGLIDASITGLADFAEQSLSSEIDSIMREESESA